MGCGGEGALLGFAGGHERVLRGQAGQGRQTREKSGVMDIAHVVSTCEYAR